MEEIVLALGRALDVEDANELGDGLRRRNAAGKNGLFDLGHAARDDGVFKEQVVQVLVDHAMHPVEQLPFAAFLEDAAFFRHLLEGLDDFPELFEARLLDGGGEVGVRRPAGRGGADEFDHALEFAACDFRFDEVVPIGLVDDDGDRKSVV